MAVEFVLTPTRRLLLLLIIILLSIGGIVRILQNLTIPESTSDLHISSVQTVAGVHHPVGGPSHDNVKSISSDRSGRNTSPGTTNSNLHVFVQISDLHLSIFLDHDRATHFHNFCDQYLPIFKPEVVMVTGDLTDAKYPNRQGSRQYEEEWLMYDKVLRQTGITQKTVWLDLRGNHDAFDVPSIDSPKNYFRKYSIQGKNESGAYKYIHKSPDGDTFRFIAVDACPSPGPRRPFNFFGVMPEEEIHKLYNLAAGDDDSNMTIWFGHYPTSVITGEVEHLRQLLGSGSVYLCGHLHTLGGQAPNMYALQQAGFLELEVGDWMDNRIYRVLAVDNGLLSFTDEVLGSWPVVLVTNPKHGQFLIPGKESVQSILESTHIRVLAFSLDTITSVVVSIDGKLLGEASHSAESLYILPWNPTLYSTGTHTITVTVKDKENRQRSVAQPFVLDGTRLQFGLLRRFLLMSQHAVEVKVMFVLALVGTILPMVIVKYVKITLEVGTEEPGLGSFCSSLLQKILRKYKMLANNNTVFWSLLAFHIYVVLGPWFIGEILEGHIGALFTFGLFVQGTFIPGSLTFLYGFFQMLLFNLPLTLYLAHVLDCAACSHKRLAHKPSLVPRACRWLLQHGGFLLLLVFQLWLAIGFYKTYGLMAALLCPVRTWSIIIAIILRTVAIRKTPQRNTDRDASPGTVPT